MFVMALYNLFIFVTLREVTYLYYVGFVVFMLPDMGCLRWFKLSVPLAKLSTFCGICAGHLLSSSRNKHRALCIEFP